VPEKKEPDHPLTAEEKAQLKKEMEKRSKESDFQNAVELFSGIDDKKPVEKKSEDPAVLNILTHFEPREKADFSKLAVAVAGITKKHESNSQFVEYVKELCKLLTENMDSVDISEITKALNVVVNERLKTEKAPKKGMKKTAAKKSCCYNQASRGQENSRG